VFDPLVCWCDAFDGAERGTTGQVRHGSGTTTQAARAAIQRSQASLAPLSDYVNEMSGSQFTLFNPPKTWLTFLMSFIIEKNDDD
jgi:hypothetical protein